MLTNSLSIGRIGVEPGLRGQETVQECKDHMTMAKKDGTAKRYEMMVKKDGMMKK